jgi:hypothetical protein
MRCGRLPPATRGAVAPRVALPLRRDSPRGETPLRRRTRGHGRASAPKTPLEIPGSASPPGMEGSQTLAGKPRRSPIFRLRSPSYAATSGPPRPARWRREAKGRNQEVLPLACGAGLETPEERLAGGVGFGETEPCGLKPFDSETGRGLNELAAVKRTVAFWVPVVRAGLGRSLILNLCERRKPEEEPGREF